MVDRALAPSQLELIEIAFATATAMPLRPHVEERSKAQEDVVAACLELDQPTRALEYTQRIENWRRGSALADYAFYRAEKGQRGGVEPLLEEAAKVADDHAKLESSQDWHRDRTRARIARAWLALGEPARAQPFGAGVTDSEAGTLATWRARLADPANADQQLAAMDEVTAKGNLDQIRSGLDACVEIFGAFFADADRRALAEAKIRNGSKKIPVEVGVDLFLRLAKTASERGDTTKSAELVAEARKIFDGAKWLPEDRIRLAARVAVARHDAGEKTAAREYLDALVDAYAYERERIVDIYRAGVLRAIAEAYVALGDSSRALAVYRRAIEDGVGNPNSRPRAQDLVATCLSMARARIEPDPTLASRIRQIRGGLGDPW